MDWISLLIEAFVVGLASGALMFIVILFAIRKGRAK